MQMRPQRRQRLVQGIRRVRIVDHHDRLVRFSTEAMHAARHGVHDFQLVQ